MANKSGDNKGSRRTLSNSSIDDAATARVRIGKKRQPYELSHDKKEPRVTWPDLRQLSEEIKAQRRAAAPKRYALLMPLTHLAVIIASTWRRLLGK